MACSSGNRNRGERLKPVQSATRRRLWKCRFDRVAVEDEQMTTKTIQRHTEPNLIKLAANDSAIISSPSYPSNYQNNQDSQWVIQTAENFRILLSFKAFSTESCCDHLSVGDGMDSANYSTRIFRSSGSSLPPDTLSAGNAMWLRFTSDGGCVFNSCLNSGTCQPVGRSGFNCECLDGFEGTRCETELINLAANQSINITSPSYPNYYPNNLDIQWVIQTAEDFRILLSFKAFSTESCCDHLSVGDGMDSANYFKRIFMSSGNSLRPDTLSAGNAMWLRFTSDEGGTRSGFSLSARSYGSVELINLAANQSINITSPSYPSNYQNNLDIEWVIQTAEDFSIILSFYAFNTRYNDNVGVGNGLASTDSSTTVFRKSGNVLPPDTLSTGNAMWLTFTTDGYENNKGFSLSARSIGAIGCILNSCLNRGTCQPVGRSGFNCECLDGFAGTRCEAANQSINITSPSYPSNYPDILDIQWVIQTAEDQRIILSFHVFNTESCCGHLIAGDGIDWTNSSTMIILLPGRSFPSDTPSTGNVMWLRFISFGDLFGCVLNSCLNSGTCQPVRRSGFNCECLDGFAGTRCEAGKDYH
ncbi:tolloid-like protein 1 [Patiria miniata]|uniref:Cubilin n=1 Tax=Patiria miniata TaxID=46514 RepID=A0A914BAG3_PATMI|nr:tolloid-like protein 1 [Patiria miniata]